MSGTLGVRAFSAEKVRALTGLSERQLQHWDEAGFLSPSLQRRKGRGSPRLYDFRDLVSLKVAAQLRDLGISLQQIRSAAAHLRKLDYEKPLAELRWFAVGKNLYFSESGTTRSGRRPEQVVATFSVPFEPLLQSLESAIAKLDRRTPGRIEVRRGALGSQPLIAGTRIPVAAIRRLARSGKSMQQIRAYYPDLRTPDIRAALTAGTRRPRKRAS